MDWVCKRAEYLRSLTPNLTLDNEKLIITMIKNGNRAFVNTNSVCVKLVRVEVPAYKFRRWAMLSHPGQSRKQHLRPSIIPICQKSRSEFIFLNLAASLRSRRLLIPDKSIY